MDKIIQGHSLSILKTLESESIDCIITSPPYWQLRDYGLEPTLWDEDINCKHDFMQHIIPPRRGKSNANVGANQNDFANMNDHNVISHFCSKCNAWKGSLGLEPSFNQYIKHLCDIFDECRRVLKKTGTCWVNLGDTYSTQSGQSRGKKYDNPTARFENIEAGSTLIKSKELPHKCLCQIPNRFAIEMCNRGWILRNEIIWHKPNAMPCSSTDRFTVDFEKLFFFTKSEKYYFDQQFEEYIKPLNRWGGTKLVANGESDWSENTNQPIYRTRNMRPNEKGRNKRTTWSINTKSYSEAHFATFPKELIYTPIKAGCPLNGIVLDIFAGSGTVAEVCLELERDYIMIELNPEYIKLIEKRIEQFKDKTALFNN